MILRLVTQSGTLVKEVQTTATVPGVVVLGPRAYVRKGDSLDFVMADFTLFAT